MTALHSPNPQGSPLGDYSPVGDAASALSGPADASPYAFGDGDWGLFVAFCEATGRSYLPASPVTIGAFFDAAPAKESTLRRRLASIRQAHRQAGVRLAVATRAPNPNGVLWKTGEGWLDLTNALAAIPTSGWPMGYRGRRDAFALVLASPLVGWSRQRITKATVLDISLYPDLTIDGHEIPAAAEPSGCPRCAVYRWVEVAALEDRWSAKSVRELLMKSRTANLPDATHVCRQPWPERWWDTTCLMPSIDVHGWPTTWRNLTPRAVTSIIADRLAARIRPVKVAEVDPMKPVEPDSRPFAEASDDELWEAMQDRMKAADEANERFEDMLARIEAAVRKWPPGPRERPRPPPDGGGLVDVDSPRRRDSWDPL